MKLETYQYTAEKGWDRQLDKALDSSQTLLLFFASPDNELVQAQLKSLAKVFPQSILFGCSSSGEIYHDDIYDNSIALSIIRFEDTRLKLTCEQITKDNDSCTAGLKVARSLNEVSLRSIFILSDGLAVNGTKLITGLLSELPTEVIVTGGLAGDGDRFEKTWVWSNDGMQQDYVCAVGFYGDKFGIGHGSRGGWDILGPKREVTRSEDNVLYELDNQPALALYKKYLGERADDLPASGLLFPLAIINEDSNVEDVVRTILAVDEDTNSITFAGDIPQNNYVRLMRANFDRLIDGAAEAANEIALNNYSAGPLLSVAISCVGRRLVLGARSVEEIEAVRNSIPAEAKQIGFYSYGEISPLANGRCDLHNQTMTLTHIWENN
ncbi:MAG: hypothetical protein COB77_07000 [Gammaproteobacteria bacterium]|nr:MAG: hypothetical protein COB77_07000 [Gammaproteobacteria bacterium]